MALMGAGLTQELGTGAVHLTVTSTYLDVRRLHGDSVCARAWGNLSDVGANSFCTPFYHDFVIFNLVTIIIAHWGMGGSGGGSG